MSQLLIDQKIKEFKSYIDNAISKHRPFSFGAKGTIKYVSGYLKSYGDKFAECLKEMTDKCNEILKDFKEEKEGERNILKEKLLKELHEIKITFRKKYWN